MKEADAALEDEANADRFKLRIQHVQIGAEHDVDRRADKPTLCAELGRQTGRAGEDFPETGNWETTDRVDDHAPRGAPPRCTVYTRTAAAQ